MLLPSSWFSKFLLQQCVDGYGVPLQKSSNCLLVSMANISKHFNLDYHGCDKLTRRLFLLLSLSLSLSLNLSGSVCKSSACPQATNTTDVTKSNEIWYRDASFKLSLITLIPSTLANRRFTN